MPYLSKRLLNSPARSVHHFFAESDLANVEPPAAFQDHLRANLRSAQQGHAMYTEIGGPFQQSKGSFTVYPVPFSVKTHIAIFCSHDTHAPLFIADSNRKVDANHLQDKSVLWVMFPCFLLWIERCLFLCTQKRGRRIAREHILSIFKDKRGEFGKSMSIPDFSQPLDCETIQQSTLDFGHILMCATELGKAM